MSRTLTADGHGRGPPVIAATIAPCAIATGSATVRCPVPLLNPFSGNRMVVQTHPGRRRQAPKSCTPCSGAIDAADLTRVS
jgi:hypothetical protein